LKIHIDDIPLEGLNFDLDGTSREVRSAVTALDLDTETTAVHFEVHLRVSGRVVEVSGRMAGHLYLPCARCLEGVTHPIDDPFRFFLRSELEEPVPEDGEVELTPEALEYGFLDGDEIDLSGLLEEQLALAMPSKALCRSDCRGICQGCGADLNREPCRCEGTSIDPRWEVLRSLKPH